MTSKEEWNRRVDAEIEAWLQSLGFNEAQEEWPFLMKHATHEPRPACLGFLDQIKDVADMTAEEIQEVLRDRNERTQ